MTFIGHYEDSSQGSLSPPSTLCYNSSARFPELIRSLFSTSQSLLHCFCDLSMEYFNADSFRVSTIGVIVSLFLIFSSCLHVFYLCLLGPLYLCTRVSSRGGLLSLSFVCSHQKYKNLVWPPSATADIITVIQTPILIRTPRCGFIQQKNYKIFQKSELVKFIPNFSLKYVITSTN